MKWNSRQHKSGAPGQEEIFQSLTFVTTSSTPTLLTMASAGAPGPAGLTDQEAGAQIDCFEPDERQLTSRVC